jgi:putative holliday junction resolvase
MTDNAEANNKHTGVFLCFDFGLRRIGVAVGQKITLTASPLKTLLAKHGVPNWGEVSALIKQWQPEALVVGVPLALDGKEQQLTRVAQNFIGLLRERYALPVYSADERLTTKAARERVYDAEGFKALKKEAIDSIAAKLILEGWMK